MLPWLFWKVCNWPDVLPTEDEEGRVRARPSGLFSMLFVLCVLCVLFVLWGSLLVVDSSMEL